MLGLYLSFFKVVDLDLNIFGFGFKDFTEFGFVFGNRWIFPPLDSDFWSIQDSHTDRQTVIIMLTEHTQGKNLASLL